MGWTSVGDRRYIIAIIIKFKDSQGWDRVTLSLSAADTSIHGTNYPARSAGRVFRSKAGTWGCAREGEGSAWAQHFSWASMINHSTFVWGCETGCSLFLHTALVASLVFVGLGRLLRSQRTADCCTQTPKQGPDKVAQVALFWNWQASEFRPGMRGNKLIHPAWILGLWSVSSSQASQWAWESTVLPPRHEWKLRGSPVVRQ